MMLDAASGIVRITAESARIAFVLMVLGDAGRCNRYARPRRHKSRPRTRLSRDEPYGVFGAGDEIGSGIRKLRGTSQLSGPDIRVSAAITIVIARPNPSAGHPTGAAP